MPLAPFPEPKYISIENIYQLIGRDKILIDDEDSTAITTVEANALIAEGEEKVLLALQPYYITVPALITTVGGDWTTLPSMTYTKLYNAFVYRAALELIGNFISKNTDEEGRTLSHFQNFYAARWNEFVAQLAEVLPNGSYKYLLQGLAPQAANGIKRTVKRYVVAGTLGRANYIDRQLTNPAINYGTPFWNRWYSNNGNS